MKSDILLNRKRIGIEPVDVQCYCYYLWDREEKDFETKVYKCPRKRRSS